MGIQIEIMTEPRKPCILPGKKKKLPILAEALYVDTETSNNYDPATGEGDTWIYQWAGRWCRQFCYGRDAQSLLDTMDRIAEVNGCHPEMLLAVGYIHNLSYDVSYLLPMIAERWGIKRILATAPHKIIVIEAGCWIIRCSYRLSNRSLAKWGKDLGTEHRKKVGLIDYGKRRYPDSKLYRDDWIYQFYDTLVLEECVLKQMESEHDTLMTIPLTSTGYIRRDGRKRAEKAKHWKNFQRTRLDVGTYKDLRFAFSGGLTHGNRFYIGQTVDIPGNLGRHRDERSMYPSMLTLPLFPIGPWTLYYEYEPGVRCTWDEVGELAKENCCLITAIIRGAELKKGHTLPYLQQSKCLLGSAGSYHANVLDNGRVIKCSGATCVTFTELDWDIINRQYDFSEEPQIVRVRYSQRGHIPEYLRELVDSYYYGKTSKKDILEEFRANDASDSDIQDAETSLTKSKNGLNGIYGMCATDIVRLEWSLDETSWKWSHPFLSDELIEEKLDIYYGSRNSYMMYQIGVYVTAAARSRIVRSYELIGPENFLYGDTDSIFYISTPEIEAKLEAENQRRYDESIENGYYIEYKGQKFTYNSFDLEKDHGKPESFGAFRFLHAKAYAYVTERGELKCTIAGVARRDQHGYTRERELKTIENLKEGYTFTRCGSTACIYIAHEPRWITVEGHPIYTAGGAVLLPTTKTLHDETHMESDIYAEPAGDVLEALGDEREVIH